MRSVRQVALLLAVAGVAACHDPAGPVLPDGFYRLVSVNGEPAPGSRPATTAVCDLGLVQGSLIVRAEASVAFYFNYWRGLSCPTFGGSGTYFNLTGFFGTMTQHGSDLSFESLLPSGRLATFAGSLSPVGLELVVRDTSLGFAGTARLRFVYDKPLPPELTPQ